MHAHFRTDFLPFKDSRQTFPSSSVVKTLPSNGEGVGSIPSQGTKIPCTTGYGQKIKNKQVSR